MRAGYLDCRRHCRLAHAINPDGAAWMEEASRRRLEHARHRPADGGQPSAPIEIAKTRLGTQIARRNDDADEIAGREIGRLAYGKDTPYGRLEEYATVAVDDLPAELRRKRGLPGRAEAVREAHFPAPGTDVIPASARCAICVNTACGPPTCAPSPLPRAAPRD